MKGGVLAPIIFWFLLIAHIPPAEAIDLGSGVACDHSKILVNGKEKSEKLAKKFIQSKIKKKKSSLLNLKKAIKKKKDKISAAATEIKLLKAIIPKLKECLNGNYEILDSETYFNSISGEFGGQYSADLEGIAFNGDLSLKVLFSEQHVLLTLLISGPLSALTSADELTVDIPTAEAGFPISQEIVGTTFGDVLVKFGGDGSITITSQNLPNPEVSAGLLTLSGKFSDNRSNFDGTFKIASTSNPGSTVLSGSIALIRQ